MGHFDRQHGRHTLGGSMGSSKGSSDEAIGRPAEWREGRYQESGKSVDETVIEPARAEDPKTPGKAAGTPVTREDYENLQPPDRP
jgi:hypothetical protein